MLTIPGTADDYVRCSYDELCDEARQAIDGVVNSHALGMRISEPVALAIMRLMGMTDGEADDLLSDARQEASKPCSREAAMSDTKEQHVYASASVLREVARERDRQMSVENWSVGHDDKHTDGSLASAAACYAAGFTIYRIHMLCSGRDYEPKPTFTDAWPWHHKWWKPSGRRRDLVKAAALIVDEIERLDRAEKREAA